MELTIKISEDSYKATCIGSMLPSDVENVINAIKNGKPLPKGHGRLIDANRLRSMYSINRANFNTVVGIQKWIDDAPTIMEADKTEESEVEK